MFRHIQLQARLHNFERCGVGFAEINGFLSIFKAKASSNGEKMKLVLLNTVTIAALAVTNVAAFVPAPQCNFARVSLPKPSVTKHPAIFECNAIRNEEDEEESTDISINPVTNFMKIGQASTKEEFLAGVVNFFLPGGGLLAGVLVVVLVVVLSEVLDGWTLNEMHEVLKLKEERLNEIHELLQQNNNEIHELLKLKEELLKLKEERLNEIQERSTMIAYEIGGFVIPPLALLLEGFLTKDDEKTKRWSEELTFWVLLFSAFNCFRILS